VFFVDASSEDRLKQDYQAIIRSRGPAYRSASHEAALQWFKATECPWLIILDNADDPSVSLVPFIPKSHHGHIIITSRNATRSLISPNQSYHIGDMTVDDSIALLLRVSGYENNELNAELSRPDLREGGPSPNAEGWGAPSNPEARVSHSALW
jgi:hypothetical protein